MKTTLGLLFFFFGLHASGETCPAADVWKVKNNGATDFVVRLRPANNRRQGFDVSTTVKAGAGAEIEIKHEGPFDLNIQFLNKDGGIQSSWSPDDELFLRRWNLEKEYDLAVVKMAFLKDDEYGNPQMYAAERFHIGSSLLLQQWEKLFELGVSKDYASAATVKLAGALSLNDETIPFHISGPPTELLLTIGAQVYKVTELLIHRNVDRSIVFSGTYASESRVGEFILERRDGFPFYRFQLELKPSTDSVWTSFQLTSRPVVNHEAKTTDGIGLVDLREALGGLRNSLTTDQKRVETRLAALEARLDDRMTELELRLADPKIHQIMKSCLACHRTDQSRGRAPKDFHTLQTAALRMSESKADDMMGRSGLSQDEKARFLAFLNEAKGRSP